MNYNQDYGYHQPMYYQPQQMKQYAFVNGIEGAKAFQMPSNQTILLMDSEKPVAFMKTTDNLGKACLRYFNLIEINENDAIKLYMPQPQPEYALKSDIDVLNEKLDSLINSLNPKGEVSNG